MQLEDKTRRSKPASPKWKRWILLGLAGLLLTSVLLFTLISTGKRYLHDSLEEYLQRPVTLNDIDFDIFSGRFSIGKAVVGEDREFPLSFDNIRGRLDLQDLFDKRVYFESLSADNSTLIMIRQPDGSWLPAALPPSLFGGEEQVSTGFWGIERLNLKNLTLEFVSDNKELSLLVKRISLLELFSWKASQVTKFKTVMTTENGRMEINGQLTPFADETTITAKIEAYKVPLSAIMFFIGEGQNNDFSGTSDGELEMTYIQAKERSHLSLTGSLTGDSIVIPGEDFELSGNQVAWQGQLLSTQPRSPLQIIGKLSVADLEYLGADSDFDLHQKELQIEGKLEIPATDSEKATGYELVADVSGQELRLDDQAKKLNLLQIGKLSGQGLKISSTTEANLDNLQLYDVKGFERGEDPAEQKLQSHLLTAKEVAWEEISWRFPLHISTEATEVKGLNGLMLRDKDNRLELENWRKIEEVPPEGPVKQWFSYKSASLKVNGESRVVFHDRLFSPPVEPGLSEIDVKIEDMDTSSGENAGKLAFKAKLNQYGKVNLDGTINFSPDNFALSLTGRLQGVNLPSFTTYSSHYLDYQVDQGHLDAELDWHISNWQVRSEPDLTLSELKIKSTSRNNDSRLAQILGMPVGAAMALLQDKKNNIRLKLKIEGDMRDPSFDYDDVFVLAIRQALKKAVITYYTPIGVTFLTGVVLPPGTITIGGKLINWITTMRIDPINFEPSANTILEQEIEELNDIADSMKDKPKLRLVVKSKPSLIDLERSSDDLNKDNIGENDRKKLLSLGRQRAELIKEILIEKGIEAARIYLAEPEIDFTLDNKPRAELYF